MEVGEYPPTKIADSFALCCFGVRDRERESGGPADAYGALEYPIFLLCHCSVSQSVGVFGVCSMHALGWYGMVALLGQYLGFK